MGLKTFCELMEEALLLSRGVPRSYLLPTSSKQAVEEPTFLPKIDPRSKVRSSSTSHGAQQHLRLLQ